MSETEHLCDLWQHSIVKTLKHDLESQVGIMIKVWVIFNKLENFNSLLNYGIYVIYGNTPFIKSSNMILNLKLVL